MRNFFVLLNVFLITIVSFVSCCSDGKNSINANKQDIFMHFADTTSDGRRFSKDPHVVYFKGKYLMYYSIGAGKGTVWSIGVAESSNLNEWEPIARIKPVESYEQKGFCAPCALVRNDTVHLFYQTYGNGANDAICHAWSVDGTNFVRNKTNPIFSPDKSDWNCGRAIDAEVAFINNRYHLYYATRTPDFVKQIIGVAFAPAGTNFDKNDWIQTVDKPIMVPEYPWEETCIEGASILNRDSVFYMFYAGAYNVRPQQIGVAKSYDGIKWEKLSNKPFLENGDPGTWNYSESGHPHIFKDKNDDTYLFYQGNNDSGKTWYLSNVKVNWKNGVPNIK